MELNTVKDVQSNLYTTTTLWTPIVWPLLTGGRFSEKLYVVKTKIGTSKWWSVLAGGHYLETVVSSGLTVHWGLCIRIWLPRHLGIRTGVGQVSVSKLVWIKFFLIVNH